MPQQRPAVDCGTASANALASLVRGKGVDCAITGHDGHGRPVGDCLAGGVGLSEALVRDGWALAQTAALRQSEAGRGRPDADFGLRPTTYRTPPNA